MALLYLVRHAQPAASWGEDPDPGLDCFGQEQAHDAAQRLSTALDHVELYSSPLRRCRETAAPLAELWDCDVQIFPPVTEIPAPALPSAGRRDWLAAAMRGSWAELQQSAPAGSIDYLAWRRSVLAALTALRRDCVVYTHFVAINVAVGAAMKSDRVACFSPDHASVTILDARDGALRLIELGRQRETPVLTGTHG